MMKNFTEDLICDNVNKLHINLVAISKVFFLFFIFFMQKNHQDLV